jgi:hypothetical protein
VLRQGGVETTAPIPTVFDKVFIPCSLRSYLQGKVLILRGFVFKLLKQLRLWAGCLFFSRLPGSKAYYQFTGLDGVDVPDGTACWDGIWAALGLDRISRRLVLLDGPPARRATTSWWVYRSWGNDSQGASRWSARKDVDSDQREDRCSSSCPDQYTRHEVTTLRVGGLSGRTYL